MYRDSLFELMTQSYLTIEPTQFLVPKDLDEDCKLFKYQILIQTLTKEEATKCLYLFVSSVADALSELQGDPFYKSHLDVRLVSAR